MDEDRNPAYAECICKQPEEPGPCYAYIIRWFYDANEGKCQEFSYGGCLGNDNRFYKLEECELFCKGIHANSSSPSNAGIP